MAWPFKGDDKAFREAKGGMIKSMTGFARVEKECPEGRLVGEARALNSRYLEINIKLPKTDYIYEQRLRELARGCFKRGKIDISIRWEGSQGEANLIKVNDSLVRQYIEVARLLKDKYRIKGDLNIETILQFNGIVEPKENNNLPQDKTIDVITNLLRLLAAERIKEGKVMHKALLGHLRKLSTEVKAIEKRWPLIIDNHEERLMERVKKAVKDHSIEETRIVQEVAIYMERLDISEEITRLKGHLQNFKDTMRLDDAVGRRLDFIIQEMVREVNTIGSKSCDLETNKRVVQIKTEIEKMREQIQNVE